jgi:hypothetical protein
MDTGGFKRANENFMLCRYVGDSSGNVSLLKLDLGQRCLVDMPYCIPFAESYGRMYYRYVYILHTRIFLRPSTYSILAIYSSSFCIYFYYYIQNIILFKIFVEFLEINFTLTMVIISIRANVI